jgi:hypothetical protein
MREKALATKCRTGVFAFLLTAEARQSAGGGSFDWGYIMPCAALGEQHVIGPTGLRLTLEDLPAPLTERWVARRKAEVVAAVRGGLLSVEDACLRYSLSLDEFLSWQSSIDQHGLAGLRATGRKRRR